MQDIENLLLDELEQKIEKNIEKTDEMLRELKEMGMPDIDNVLGNKPVDKSDAIPPSFLHFLWNYFKTTPTKPSSDFDLILFGWGVGYIITLENNSEALILHQLGCLFLAAVIDEYEKPTGIFHIIKASVSEEGTFISVLDTKYNIYELGGENDE